MSRDDREYRHNNKYDINDDLSEMKSSFNRINTSSSPYISEDINKLNDRIERIEKSILKQSADDKEKMSNKLELVFETVKILQNKLENSKNMNSKDNEISVSNEQSLLNNLPS